MRRRIGLVLICGGVLPLAMVAEASAQGQLLKVTPSTASPGQIVTATGRGYTSGTGVTNRALRLGTRNGRILIPSVSLDGTSSRLAANTEFIVPNDLTPGTYLLILTEDRTTQLPAPAPPGLTSQPAGFGPGRTTLRVVAAGVQRGAAADDKSAGAGGSSVPPLVPLAVSLALLALAAGATVTARRIGVFQRFSLGR